MSLSPMFLIEFDGRLLTERVYSKSEATAFKRGMASHSPHRKCRAIRVASLTIETSPGRTRTISRRRAGKVGAA
ncbi:MAG: hypothetical protein K8T25_12890 [Planctomycetia bacterium]|nr:hypothetical protein [Planctomycetia bacterium]